MVRHDVCGGEVSPAGADLSFPPVSVGAVVHIDDVAAAELQFSSLLGLEVVHGLHQTLR